jgi:multiple sugar transport system ATP-binding protein
MAKLQLNKVTKIYDKNVYATRDISFEVADKEFAVLVGPSGCGKTTALRLIAGLEDLTSGDIYIDDQCVNKTSPKDRNVAMVFQNYALYPHMNVFDNMAFGLKMRKYPKPEINKRVNDAAATLGIKDLLDRKPKQLSGGQRQRVAVGRAIVRQPRIFLFDEPLSNLDARLRVQMRAELSRLHRKLEATIVYVTHDQIEAMTLGQKIIVLKDGEIQQIADPAELYKKPNNTFVAGFIGSPPMNFMTGTVKNKEKTTVFETSDLVLELTHEFNKYKDREITLGIRPADFSMKKGSPIDILIDVVEPLGNEHYIYGRRGRTALSACLPEGKTPNTGDRFTLRIDPDKIYKFDATTKQALD